LCAALLASLYAPRLSRDVAAAAYAHFPRNAVLGLGICVLTPVVIFLLALSVVGAMVAVLLLFGLILGVLVSMVMAGVVAGGVLSKWIRKEISVNWLWTLAGLAALEALWFVPILGWLAAGFFMLASLGSLAMTLLARLRNV
jgi:hypothetical protein